MVQPQNSLFGTILMSQVQFMSLSNLAPSPLNARGIEKKVALASIRSLLVFIAWPP
jgi:hypothetical protein